MYAFPLACFTNEWSSNWRTKGRSFGFVCKQTRKNFNKLLLFGTLGFGKSYFSFESKIFSGGHASKGVLLHNNSMHVTPKEYTSAFSLYVVFCEITSGAAHSTLSPTNENTDRIYPPFFDSDAICLNPLNFTPVCVNTILSARTLLKLTSKLMNHALLMQVF
jgi:hypothetical protein